MFKDSYAVGVSYQQQYAGLGYCVKLTDETKPFEQIGQFQVNDRFTTYGFIDDMFVTSVSGQTRGDRTDIAVFDFWSLDDSGVKLIRSKSRYTTDIAGEGQQATFSGIVDNGDGTFLTAMIKSDHKDDGSNAQGGSIGTVKYSMATTASAMPAASSVRRPSTPSIKPTTVMSMSSATAMSRRPPCQPVPCASRKALTASTRTTISTSSRSSAGISSAACGPSRAASSS